MLKTSSFLSELFLFLLLILSSYINGYSQEIDTTRLKIEKIVSKDTIYFDFSKQKNDSIIEEEVLDTLKQKIFVQDTVLNKVNSDTSTYLINSDSIISQDSISRINSQFEEDSLNYIISSDTVFIEDSVTVLSSYEKCLKFVDDSLFFDESDSIHYVILNLNHLINNDTVLLNDTLKQAIYKLTDYSINRKIDTVLKYIKTNLRKSEIVTDSSLNFRMDSIYKAVEYLLNSIPEDSTKFYVVNINSDSISFKSAAHENDSIRVSLLDNRGESAVLWIKKTNKNAFEISLEDGVYLNKAKQKRSINRGVESKIIVPKLKDVKKVNKILPIWKFNGLADIKFSQGYISDSWAEGGENSMAALSILKYSIDYSYGKKIILDADIEYRLGALIAGSNDLQKNEDRFEINVKYGRLAFNDWYYSTLFNFKTQFLNGYSYSENTASLISKAMSPAYLVFSLGLDYKPSDKLTVLISPLSTKFTIVADTANIDQTRFGVDRDKNNRKEIGAYVKAVSKIKLKDNLTLVNKINFFSNYINNPQNVDIDWELDFAVKLTDYIKISINMHLIYDDDVPYIDKDGKEKGARPQFKELFGIGFTYGF